MTALVLWSFRWVIAAGCVLLIFAMARQLRRWDQAEARRESGPCGPIRLSEARRARLDAEQARNGYDPDTIAQAYIDMNDDHGRAHR